MNSLYGSFLTNELSRVPLLGNVYDRAYIPYFKILGSFTFIACFSDILFIEEFYETHFKISMDAPDAMWFFWGRQKLVERITGRGRHYECMFRKHYYVEYDNIVHRRIFAAFFIIFYSYIFGRSRYVFSIGGYFSLFIIRTNTTRIAYYLNSGRLRKYVENLKLNCCTIA